MSNVYRDAAKIVEKAPILYKGAMRGIPYLENGVDNENRDYCYCTMGAVLEAAGRLNEYIENRESSNDAPWFEELMRPVAAKVNPNSGYLPFSTIYMWNDREVTTKEDVIELLNKVADFVDASE